MVADAIDDLDRALVHAVQVDGRAPFRRIGEVLRVSDQTVARRYARLRDSYGLRVVALTDPAVLGDRQWMLRIRATPGAAAKIADALAKRSDTGWISLCSGGTEIVAFAYGDSAEPLLLEALPRNRHVLDVSAHEVLHVFYGGAGQPFTKHGPLDENQVAQLAVHVPAPAGAPLRMDDVSRRMLDALRCDGRATVEELMAATSASASTIRRRMQILRATGVLHFDVDVNLSLFDLPVRTMCWLSVDLDRIVSVGEAIAGSGGVAFAAATTGATNVFASVSTRDATALWRYLTTVVAPLPGVGSVETAPAMRSVKAAVTHFAQSATVIHCR